MRRLGAADERDLLVERPFLDEVVSTRHTQRGADGAVSPFEFANHLDVADHFRLDVRALFGQVDQDHVAELEPLDVDGDRHGPSVTTPRSRQSEPDAAGWRAYLDDDSQAVTFCPESAEREFGRTTTS